MKKFCILLFSLAIFSCNEKKQNQNFGFKTPVLDNAELADIYSKDQADRTKENVNWSDVNKRDSLRQERIYEMIDSNLIKSSKDYE